MFRYADLRFYLPLWRVGRLRVQLHEECTRISKASNGVRVELLVLLVCHQAHRLSSSDSVAVSHEGSVGAFLHVH